MKKPTDKLSTNLGHNNPPEDIKSIEFTNSAIEKLKVDNLDFGNSRYKDIPFDVPFNKKALIVNTGLALEYLSKGKFKATNHRVLWNKTERMSVPFFFEPSYDFRMSPFFLNGHSNNKHEGIFFEQFLKKSLKKFIGYQR